jgi:hypothetical protein
MTAWKGPPSRPALPPSTAPWSPLLNFFMPAMKLESKVKAVSKKIKKYDEHRSPYQRLLKSDALSP